ncbi:MAG: IPT/TIG domain-containing protein [Myxococcales bacterium]|nr:IPT/TIG domain-containing protein [Myxococcales bacterium]
MPDAPTIDSIDPEAASPGDPVEILGAAFCGDPARVTVEGCEPAPVGSVSFGIDPQVSATPTAWRDDRIDVQVPTLLPPGDVLVVVTVDGRSSNGISFRVR